MRLELDRDQLAELQRFASLGMALSRVAHELSTPVGVLAGNAEMELRLLDKLGTGADAPSGGRAQEALASLRRLAEVNRQACGRMREVVKALKTAARAPAAAFLRADVNELAQSMVQLAAIEFRGRVRFTTDLGSLPAVECDPSLLAQALLNLLTNAGQAIDGPGEVTLGTKAEEGQVHLWVADSGRGIRVEDRPKVLRQSFTTKPVGVGTGLGLAIVGDVVERVHGGKVGFESEIGRGTTFHVRIPVDRPGEGD